MSSLMQDSRLIDLRKQIPVLANLKEITLLSGGLTNRNYRCDTAQGKYVMRIAEPSANLLGINRESERINSIRAHLAGVGPPILDSLPLENVLIFGWIEGKTLHAIHLQSQFDILSRIALALRTLHNGPAFMGNFDFTALRRQYLQQVLKAGYFLPDKYLYLESLIKDLENLLAINREKLVPCHNDLLAENFLDDGEQIWIIDYEFSGQNEPSFELGNLAGESLLNDEQINFLCDAYWQQHLPSKIARAKAWSIIARYGWVLWASIQEGISSIDFDFRTWGQKKWNSILPELLGNPYQEILKNLKKYAV
jgi:thiamine kinase-like enzyme